MKNASPFIWNFFVLLLFGAVFLYSVAQGGGFYLLAAVSAFLGVERVETIDRLFKQ